MGTHDESAPPHAEANFVRNLRAHREARAITQGELAARASTLGLQMIQQTVARIESGQRGVRLDEAVVLARVVDSSLEDMIRNPATRPLPDVPEDVRKRIGAIISQLPELSERIGRCAATAEAASRELVELERHKARLIAELDELEEHMKSAGLIADLKIAPEEAPAAPEER